MKSVLVALTLLTLVLTAGARAADVVWLESEKPTASNVKPTSQWANPLLSGEWMQYHLENDEVAKLPDGGIQLSYDFTAPSDGTYEIWHRLGFEYVRTPFAWRIDDGAWSTVTPDMLTTDLTRIADWCEVAWLNQGPATLTKGAHKLQIQLEKSKGKDGKFARIFYTSDCFCLSSGHFMPNGKFPPDQEWRTDSDRKAAATIFTLPAPIAAARSTVALDGLWEIARDDEMLPPKDVATPLPALPAQPHFIAIQVPGRKDDDHLNPGFDLTYAHRVWYRTRFTAPEGSQGHAFTVTFPRNAVNTTVYVNGVYCGFNKNPYASFALDITNGVKVGVNELWVGIRDCYYGLHNDPNDPLVLRKQFNIPESFMHFAPMNADYPVSYNWNAGILETPVLSCNGAVYADDVFCTPSVAKKMLSAEITLRNSAATAMTGEIQCQVLEVNTHAVTKTLPGQPFTVDAGASATITASVPWADPKLWWPDAPNLYLLRTTVTIGGKPVDVQDTRFGFREWTIAGIDFLLNGIKFHGWADCHTANSKDEWLLAQRKSHETMMRFWGYAKWYGMTSDEALNFFDEQGVVVRRTGVYDGEGMNYTSPTDIFCANMQDQVVQWVKEMRNHPSIMIWSIENELSFINFLNSGQSDIWEPKLTKIAHAVQQADPTRPLMTDGGGATVTQTLPVHGDHYTTGPVWAYPALAYATNVKGGGRDRWSWDMKRPRFIGEELYASGINTIYSYFGGEDVFQGKSGNRPAVGIWDNILTQGYRWNHIGAFHYWQGQGDATDQYNSFSPRAVFSRQWDWTFFSGQRVHRTFGIFNDTRYNDPITFTWKIVLNGKKVNSASQTYAVPAGEDQKFDATITMPTVADRQHGQFVMALSVGGKEVFTDSKPLTLLNPEGHFRTQLHGKTLAATQVAVYDPQGNVTAYLRAARIPFTPLAQLGAIPATATVLIVGKDALTPAQSTSSLLAAFVAAGRTAIVLEQQNPLKYQGMPAEIQLAQNEGRTAFVEDLNHPVLSGLTHQDFFTWGPDDDGVVYRNAYMKPARGAKSLIQCHENLLNSGLIEAPVGNGVLLATQLLVGEKLLTNAVAQQLLTNMLAYSSQYRLVVRQVTACTAGNTLLTKTMEATGLKYKAVADPLAAITTPGYQIAIIDATPANLAQLAENMDKATAFTTAGGWLFYNNLTPEGLASYNKLVGAQHLIRPFKREKVMFTVPKHPLMAGLSLSDVALYSNERIFPWADGNFIANDIFSYVVDFDEVASFAAFDNDFVALMTNGMVSADAWKYIVNVPAPENPPLDFNMPLPRPEQIMRLEWIGNTFYYPVTKMALVGDTDTRAFDVEPNNAPQLFDVNPPLTVQKLKLRLVDWQKIPDRARVTGLDNIRLFAKRTPEFYQKVKPLLNIGGLMAYPQGKGGMVLCNLLFKDNEGLPENVGKKRLIFSTLLRNLNAPFSGDRTIIAGAQMDYTPLDISKQMNAYRDERGWFGDKAFTFKDMPKGLHAFAGVPYNIYEFATSPLPTVITLAGNNVPNNPAPLPQDVRGIPINVKADALFFLHTARIDAPRNTAEVREGRKYELARYLITYADGQQVTVPLYQDFDVADFRQQTATPIPDAQIAWVSPYAGTPFSAVAYSKQWNNPRPDIVIKSVDLTYGNDRRGIPALLAITAARLAK